MLNVNISNPGAMRPFIHTDGRAYVINNGRMVPTTNALLRYQEWLDLDRVVIKAAVDRLTGVADLISKGLTHNLGNIGLTVTQWDRVSDMTAANVSMSGVTKGEQDTPAFDPQSVPVPVIHKDFVLNLRRLEASRILGESLDTTAGELAGRLVAEASEDVLFLGSTVNAGTGALYGYTNHPARNTVSLTLSWTNGSKTGANILTNVQNMLQAARADHFYGPFILYIPSEYEAKLDDDFSPGTSDDRTIRERLLQLSGLVEIKVADRLLNDNVVLVQMTKDVVDMAIAKDVNTVQWEVDGGMQVRFKTMAVWAPRIKSDFSGQCGVVHMS